MGRAATPSGDKIAYSVPEAAAAIGVGKSTVWKLIQEKRLPIVKLGARTLIRREALEALLAA